MAFIRGPKPLLVCKDIRGLISIGVPMFGFTGSGFGVSRFRVREYLAENSISALGSEV